MGVPPSIILASTSPRRAHLMRRSAFSFQIVPPDVREIYSRQYSPRELALHNAMLKSRDVARDYPQSIVIGSDTVVTLEGEAIGKPRDLEDAAAILEKLAGRTHEVVSAVVIMQLSRQLRTSFLEISLVTLKPLTPEAIARYHQRIEPLDKAGAYAAQDDNGEIIERVEGSFTNVVGLPMERLQEALKAFVEPAAV